MCHDLALVVWGAGYIHIWGLMCHDLVLLVWEAGYIHFWWLVCHDLVLVVWEAGYIHFWLQVCHNLVLVVQSLRLCILAGVLVRRASIICHTAASQQIRAIPELKSMLELRNSCTDLYLFSASQAINIFRFT